MRLRIRSVKAVEIDGFISTRGFVRVYTEDGLHGTGELLDTLGAVDMINRHIGPSIVGRNPLDIEAYCYDMWMWSDIEGAIPPMFLRGMGGPWLAAVSAVEMALW